MDEKDRHIIEQEAYWEGYFSCLSQVELVLKAMKLDCLEVVKVAKKIIEEEEKATKLVEEQLKEYEKEEG